MIISTRGRYALRVLIDLAEQVDEAYTPMKDIANRQGISLKYLERIIPSLTKNGLLEGVQGKGGGYRLSRVPKDYTVGELLRLTEGNLAPVACLAENADPCQRAEHCPTLSMWKELHHMLNDYFDHITLADLMKKA